MGCIDIFNYNEDKRNAGVGVLVYDNKDRKRGFAGEALDLLISFAKNERLSELYCHVSNNNIASRRLFEKYGFRPLNENNGALTELKMHLQ